MVLVRELILENFMSYEYSRVPLKPGLNLVCGPNGAGKSALVLGLAVALGQTYTERSRRLGDLIRRGKDLARVSVVFDNSPHDGKRPIAEIASDTIVLSRYLSQDGTYWHELNSRAVVKGEIMRLLERLSINPDNMLIVMHQNMIDVFSAIDARERLKLVEEAVGLRGYRERILEAREKLSHTLSEEESVRAMLEKTSETMRYWESEYQRFKRKKELETQREKLELEYAWAKCIRQEEAIGTLQSKLEGLRREFAEIEGDLEQNSKRATELEKRLGELEFDLDASYQKLIDHERAQAESEAIVKLIGGFSASLRSLESLQELLGQLEAELASKERSSEEAGERAKQTRSELVGIKKELERAHEDNINVRVRLAVLGFRRELLEREISGHESELRRSRRELEQMVQEAEQVGGRVETERKPQEVLDELRLVNAQLAGLADISPDVERMYLSYRNTVEELKVKAEIAAANRKRALEELEVRQRRWSSELKKLLREVETDYLEFLKQVNASGKARLANAHDIDEAGLELFFGFGGIEPQVLDAYTQSGGERSTSSMCFLLALQRRIESPIRAIDEFETHMDPRNREVIMRQILGSMRDESKQYIVITPGQIPGIEGVPNVITVQNVAGTSKVRVAQ